MTFLQRTPTVAVLFFSLTACSAQIELESSGTSNASSSGSSSSSAGSSSSGGTGDWTTLIDGTWELPAGQEGYWCTWKTIQADTYVKSFRALAPPGTHHTLLIKPSGGQPDGEAACGATLGADMLTASGVGTDDLTFPEGVGVMIPAGTQLMLNLHLFNTTASVLKGVSGTLVQLAQPAEIKQVAEMVLGGTLSISVPPNGSQTVEAKCVFPSATTLSAVWPHMHQYGTHMKVTFQGASGTKVLHDGPFSFGDQKNQMIDPLSVAPGDSVRIACTYQNPTAQTVNWGDSSKAEMCFAGLYLYPALVPGLSCQ